ncbi:MAG: glycosyl transferase [Actinomycetia bacterium]|nr:glycosyl transferase [Actinomycetes bacterium]
MRVLCLTPWWPAQPGDGGGSFVADQVAALRRLGLVVDVVVIDAQRRRPGCRHIWFRWLPRYLAHGAEAPVLALRLRSARLDVGAYDVVHCHGETIGAAMLAAFPGAPVVVTVHGETTSPRVARSRGRRRQLQGLADHARLVLVGSPLASAWRARGADPAVIANGFDSATFLPRPLPTGPPWRVVSVSNLTPSKGVDLTIAAVGRLVARGVPVELDVVGDGWEWRALHEQADRLGLAAVVRFHGQQPREFVAEVLAAGHLFCLPSAPEALGVAYLEACGTGRPVIGCIGEGAADVVRDGVEGWLVEPGDAAGVTDAISDALSDGPRLARMATAAADRAHEHFPWSVNARRLVAVYHEVAR